MTESRGLDLNRTYPVIPAAEAFAPSQAGSSELGYTVTVQPETDYLPAPPLLCFDNRDQPWQVLADCSVRLPLETLSVPVVRDGLLVGPGLVFLKSDAILAESIGRHRGRFGLLPVDSGELAFSNRTLLKLHRWRKKHGVTVYKEPALLLADPGLYHYGTWLLKHASKLALLDLPDIGQLKLVVPSELPTLFRELMQGLGISKDRIIFHDPDGTAQFDQLAVPPKIYTFRRGFGGNPFRAFGAKPDIGGPPESSSGRRLYVSRRGVPKRVLFNEDLVEGVFKNHGFEIVHPEHQTAAEKIEMFRDCSFIAGPSGSGLYNILFRERPFRALALVPPAEKFEGAHLVLSHICASKGGRVGYVFGRMSEDLHDRSGEPFDFFWTIDIARLDATLADLG